MVDVSVVHSASNWSSQPVPNQPRLLDLSPCLQVRPFPFAETVDTEEHHFRTMAEGTGTHWNCSAEEVVVDKGDGVVVESPVVPATVDTCAGDEANAVDGVVEAKTFFGVTLRRLPCLDLPHPPLLRRVFRLTTPGISPVALSHRHHGHHCLPSDDRQTPQSVLAGVSCPRVRSKRVASRGDDPSERAQMEVDDTCAFVSWQNGVGDEHVGADKETKKEDSGDDPCCYY